MGMKRSRWLIAAGALTLLSVNSGCLITHHNTNVVRKWEKPKAAQFESAQAKNIFDSKVADVKANPTTSNPRLFAIPFLLWYSSTEVVSDNGIYNDQLAICDTNGDGMISVQESMVYGARVDAEIAKRQEEKAKSEAQIAKFDSNKPEPAKTKAPEAVVTYPAQPVSAQDPIAIQPPRPTGQQVPAPMPTWQR